MTTTLAWGDTLRVTNNCFDDTPDCAQNSLIAGSDRSTIVVGNQVTHCIQAIAYGPAGTIRHSNAVLHAMDCRQQDQYGETIASGRTTPTEAAQVKPDMERMHAESVGVYPGGETPKSTQLRKSTSRYNTLRSSSNP